jgi:dTDP-4-dehydrorhamnose reductase
MSIIPPQHHRRPLFLVYGASGFVGSHFVKTLDKLGVYYVSSKTRTWDARGVGMDIAKFRPTHVVNASGYATPTNVDHYETHQQDLILTNTIGVLTVAHECWRAGVHYTVFMSGCIYEGGPWKDTDEPNFVQSAYSQNRVLTEKLLAPYNTCIIRLRMPVASSMHPKSLISKLLRYRRLSAQGNSITILDDMLPVVYYLCRDKHVGAVNLVNKGTVTNMYIVGLWSKYIKQRPIAVAKDDSQLECVAKRSNCEILQSTCVKEVADKHNIPQANKPVCDSLFAIVKDFKKIVDTYC